MIHDDLFISAKKRIRIFWDRNTSEFKQPAHVFSQFWASRKVTMFSPEDLQGVFQSITILLLATRINIWKSKERIHLRRLRRMHRSWRTKKGFLIHTKFIFLHWKSPVQLSSFCYINNFSILETIFENPKKSTSFVRYDLNQFASTQM